MPPNRFRPVRLTVVMQSPTFVFPRSVHVLSDDATLDAHSVCVELQALTVTNTLERALLPGFGASPLICDQVVILALQPLVTTSLPHEPRQTAGSAPREVCFTLTRTLERPSDSVPVTTLAV